GICSNNAAYLSVSVDSLKKLYSQWGPANKYSHYTQGTINAWIQQTEQDKKDSVATTYDIVTDNTVINVDSTVANAYAVCIK
ncbi:TPA: intimin C-type lectin domain-containing protein, partial [Escherichia coli]